MVRQLERPPLAPDERALLRERDRAGDPVVATRRALYHRVDATSWWWLGWAQVVRYSWEPRAGALDLAGLGGAHRRLALRDSSRLPALVRDRVLATVLVTARVSLADGTDAVVTARRPPERDGLDWIVRLAAGVDADDPDVRDRVDAALRDLRAQLGV